MFEGLLIRLFQIIETFKEEGAAGVSRKSLVASETAVKTRLMLGKLKTVAPPKNFDGSCLELHSEMLNSRQLRYRVKSRYLKAKRNLQMGYKGFVLANKGEILGDLWGVDNRNGVAGRIHPDLDWLAIQLGPEDVYLFDMYLMKEHRGGGTACLLMGGALRHLKEKGYENAYGYYISHNIPALWTHRMLGYEELSKIEVKRRFARYFRLKEPQA